MIEVYVRLLLDGADDCPMIEVTRELEKHLAGDSFYARTEEETVRSIVIDEATVGDFDGYVSEPGEAS